MLPGETFFAAAVAIAVAAYEVIILTVAGEEVGMNFFGGLQVFLYFRIGIFAVVGMTILAHTFISASAVMNNALDARGLERFRFGNGKWARG